MSTTNSIVITSPVHFVLHTYTDINVDRKLLKLEQDQSLTVNGKPKDFQHLSVQFFVDRTAVNNGSSIGDLVHRLRPVSKPNHYLAVSGQNVVLKPSSQVQSGNSHNFLVIEPNNDYMKYQVLSSPANAPTFITTDQNGSVFIAPHSLSDVRRAWFKLVPVSDFNTTSNAASTVNNAISISDVEVEIEVEEIIVNKAIATSGVDVETEVEEIILSEE